MYIKTLENKREREIRRVSTTKNAIVLGGQRLSNFSFVVCLLLLNSAKLHCGLWFQTILNDRPSMRDRQLPWSELERQMDLQFLCQAQPMLKVVAMEPFLVCLTTFANFVLNEEDRMVTLSPSFH